MPHYTITMSGRVMALLALLYIVIGMVIGVWIGKYLL